MLRGGKLYFRKKIRFIFLTFGEIFEVKRKGKTVYLYHPHAGKWVKVTVELFCIQYGGREIGRDISSLSRPNLNCTGILSTMIFLPFYSSLPRVWPVSGEKLCVGKFSPGC